MNHAVRRLIAMLLLVLLPVQALAAGYAMGEAPVLPCPQEMMDMGCCDDDGTGSAGCATFSCVALASAALPSRQLPVSAGAVRGFAAPFVPHLHESHFPDGPQRPPRHLL
jgi:hypothetical protein